MSRYFTKKLLQGLLSVLLIITIVFILMRMLPTEYYFTDEQIQKLNADQKQAILEAAGLTKPILFQLKDFYVRLLKGDLGISRRIMAGVPVTRLISDRVGMSMKLGLISMIISVILGLAIGTMQTVFKDKLGDHIGTAYVILTNAVPTIVSYSLILVIGTKVFGLPTIYSSRVHPVSSLILPVICLSLTSASGYALWCRRYMVDEINKDYIKLARMKGLSEKQIIVKHVARNAIVPLVQYLPSSFLLTVGGSLLVETFFSIPGMGPLLTNAIKSYDIDVVQGLMLFYSSLSVAGVILGDFLMSLVDPRIKFDRKENVR